MHGATIKIDYDLFKSSSDAEQIESRHAGMFQIITIERSVSASPLRHRIPQQRDRDLRYEANPVLQLL
jgi:hypothetical protein